MSLNRKLPNIKVLNKNSNVMKILLEENIRYALVFMNNVLVYTYDIKHIMIIYVKYHVGIYVVRVYRYNITEC